MIVEGAVFFCRRRRDRRARRGDFPNRGASRSGSRAFFEVQFIRYLPSGPAEFAKGLPEAACDVRNTFCAEDKERDQENDEQFAHAYVTHRRMQLGWTSNKTIPKRTAFSASRNK